MGNISSFVADFFGKQTATFSSNYSLQESVEKLGQHVGKSRFSAQGQRYLAGHVQPNSVSLRCMTPPMHNSFAPVFTGQFRIEGEQTLLQGELALPLFVRVFMAFWFGSLLLSSVTGTLVALVGAIFARGGQFPVWQAGLFMALGPLPVALFGFGLVTVGKHLAREDVKFIEQTIRASLEN